MGSSNVSSQPGQKIFPSASFADAEVAELSIFFHLRVLYFAFNLVSDVEEDIIYFLHGDAVYHLRFLSASLSIIS
jgi:hypothetical protein